MKYEQKFNELVQKISTSKRDLMVRELASSLTGDALEQENIINAMIVHNMTKIDGEEVSYTKEIEDLKKDLAKFVRNKANDVGDKGNNGGGGNQAGKPVGTKAEQIAYIKNKFNIKD